MTPRKGQSVAAEGADYGATLPLLPDRGPDHERRGLRPKHGLSKKSRSFDPGRGHAEVKRRG